MPVVDSLFHSFGSITESCGFIVKEQRVDIIQEATDQAQTVTITSINLDSDDKREGIKEMVTRMRKCTGKRSFRHVLWGKLPFCFMFECQDNQLSPYAMRLNQLQHSLKVNYTIYVLMPR